VRKWVLEAVVLVCGASTMVLELVGSRMLAPYLGTSLFVWTSLIGVILGCLSLGYWWGGRISDARHDFKTFSLIILAAALFIAVISFLSEIVLVVVQNGVSDIRLGAVLATFILFGVPSVLLGMVLPYAVRLKISAVEKAGQTVGTLYAVSTIGSIAGTFLAGFVLISYFSGMAILLLIAAALLATSLVSYAGGLLWSRALLLLFFIFSFAQADSLAQAIKGSDFIDVNTPYNRVWIFDAYHAVNGRPVKVMQVNDENDSMIYRDGEELASEYTKYYRLAGHFNPGLKKALMIGGAACSYPKDYLRQFPEASIDVVEIDPKLTELAKRYFGLKEDPRLAFFHEDARTFLNRNKNKYDVIFGDVFRSYSVPYQLTTVEAVQKMYEALEDDGVLLINIISAIEGPRGRFLRAEAATIQSIFPQVYIFPVSHPEDGSEVQNIMLAALKSAARPRFYSRDPELDNYLHHLWINEIKKDMPALTDDYAPVEKYVMEMMPGLPKPGANPMKSRMSFLLGEKKLNEGGSK